MVLKPHELEALLVDLSDDSSLSEPGVRQAVAASLFRDGSPSLGLGAVEASTLGRDYMAETGVRPRG